MFTLVNHYKYSISDIENLYPFERDIYYGLLADYIQKEQQARELN